MKPRLVFFDLETGGVDPKRHPIIQIAAIAVDQDGDVLEAFEAKITFDRKRANSYSLRKNHYHPGIWAREARDGREVAGEFAAFLKRHATYSQLSAEGREYDVAQLVAHNAGFDGPFLQTWFEKLGNYLPARRLVLCTLQLALWRHALTGSASPSNFQLSTLCAFYGISFHAAAAHEAFTDVLATVQLFQALRRVGLVTSVAASGLAQRSGT